MLSCHAVSCITLFVRPYSNCFNFHFRDYRHTTTRSDFFRRAWVPCASLWFYSPRRREYIHQRLTEQRVHRNHKISAFYSHAVTKDVVIMTKCLFKKCTTKLVGHRNHTVSCCAFFFCLAKIFIFCPEFRCCKLLLFFEDKIAIVKIECALTRIELLLHLEIIPYYTSCRE